MDRNTPFDNGLMTRNPIGEPLRESVLAGKNGLWSKPQGKQLNMPEGQRPTAYQDNTDLLRRTGQAPQGYGSQY